MNPRRRWSSVALVALTLMTASTFAPSEGSGQAPPPPVPQNCEDWMLNWGGAYCATWSATRECFIGGYIQENHSGWVGGMYLEDIYDQLENAEWQLEAPSNCFVLRFESSMYDDEECEDLEPALPADFDLEEWYCPYCCNNNHVGHPGPHVCNEE